MAVIIVAWIHATLADAVEAEAAFHALASYSAICVELACYAVAA